MEKISEMIERLCPEGVEYVRLKDVCTILNGYAFQSKNYIFEGYRVIRISDVQSGYISDKDKVFYPCELHNEFKRQELFLNDLVMSLTGNPGRVALIGPNDIPCALNQRVACLRTLSEKCVTKYLFYTFNCPTFEEIAYANSNGGGQKNLSTTWLSNFEIPLPPLRIQEEIVSILDSFTSLITNLESELASRQKQYEYYRDKLFGEDVDALTSRTDCEVKTISELGSLTRGKRFVRTDIVEEGVPCIHYGDMYTFYGLKAKTAKTHITKEKAKSMRFAKKGDVVIVGAGENDWDIGVGLVWLGDEDAAIHDACYILEHEQDPMYISHYLRSTVYHLQLRKYVSSGKISSFSSKDLGKILIPVPTLERQREIVSTLDTFESLITNIKQEIEARKKQYEYYREKLLTFE